MAKLGYTWYPKDWGNSEKVFELTLIERGLYRELIDMAMMNDNKTEVNVKTWSRKFGSNEDEIEGILITLKNLKLIEIKKDILFVPSCESRLNLVRGGSKGGKNSKPIVKPNIKPFESLEEKNNKPITNQTKIEIEIENKEENKKEIETKNNNDLIFSQLIISESWLENTAMQSAQKFKPDEIKEFLKKYNDMINVQFDYKINKTEYCTHFINWLKKQQKPNNGNLPKRKVIS